MFGEIGVVQGVFVGKASRLEACTTSVIQSAIDKKPIPTGTRVRLTKLGLEGDEQAHKEHHGGPERALMQFASENYDRLRALHPAYAEYCTPPRFGENISSTGMDETTLCVGDLIQMGEAKLRITQPRRVCCKLNYRFMDVSFATWTQSHGITGWLYSVEQEGTIGVGDRITLLQRPFPEFTLASLTRNFLHLNTHDEEYLKMMITSPHLAERWKNDAQKRIDAPVPWEFQYQRLYGGVPPPPLMPLWCAVMGWALFASAVIVLPKERVL